MTNRNLKVQFQLGVHQGVTFDPILLTDLRFLSVDFLNTFLLTYRVFTDGVTVLEALKQVFFEQSQQEMELAPPPDTTNRKTSAASSVSGRKEHLTLSEVDTGTSYEEVMIGSDGNGEVKSTQIPTMNKNLSKFYQAGTAEILRCFLNSI